jgi:sucrose-6-phosphate hydrolase SacC (GH32 family)
MKLPLLYLLASLAIATASVKADPTPGTAKDKRNLVRQPTDDLTLNYHLMHPGGDSVPGDPNAAFFLDGTYHLHYIMSHPWNGKQGFSFVHVTSPDMLHWTWQSTILQPSFTGHGMFSGTGFVTKDGRPAIIYHGWGSDRNQIAIAKDNRLSAWEKPIAIEPKTADGLDAKLRHWDPDCFLIGDTYYAISGGLNPPLIKSKDLKNWTVVGNFLRRDLPDVVIGEDISCGNFFRIGEKWMMLCISHPLGCRYYIGDWDAKGEQFVPEKHGRMNWRREDQTLEDPWWGDCFAPESVLTPDGRRVMWAWCATLNPAVNKKSILTLPRELSLPSDGILRIKPLRELESLRNHAIARENVTVRFSTDRIAGGWVTQHIADLPGDAVEIRIKIAREEAVRKRFGFILFGDGKGGGLPIIIRPETGTLRVGTTEAPFAVGDLPVGEDVELRIFIDKYLVEVFANDRQAMITAHMDYRGKTGLDAQTFGGSTTIKKVEIWNLEPTNQGFIEARRSRNWETDIR